MFVTSDILEDLFKFLDREEIEQNRFVSKFWNKVIREPYDAWPLHKVIHKSVAEVLSFDPYSGTYPIPEPFDVNKIHMLAARLKTSYLEEVQLSDSERINFFFATLKSIVQINHQPIVIQKILFFAESLDEYLEEYSGDLSTIFGQLIHCQKIHLNVGGRGSIPYILHKFQWIVMPKNIDITCTNFGENMDFTKEEAIKFFETFSKVEKDVCVTIDGDPPSDWDESLAQWFQKLNNPIDFKLVVKFVDDPQFPSEDLPKEFKKLKYKIEKNPRFLTCESIREDYYMRIVYTIVVKTF